MTKTISISDLKNSIQAVIDLTRNGDEVVLEENGKLLARVTPIEESDLEQEFRDWEAASNEDLIGFEQELAGVE